MCAVIGGRFRKVLGLDYWKAASPRLGPLLACVAVQTSSPRAKGQAPVAGGRA
jgi:hypothetical protein